MLLNTLHIFCVCVCDSQEFCRLGLFNEHLQCVLLSRCLGALKIRTHAVFMTHIDPVGAIKAGRNSCSRFPGEGVEAGEVKSCALGRTGQWGSDPDRLVQSPCFPDALCSCVRVGFRPHRWAPGTALLHLVRDLASNSAVKRSPSIFS